MRLFYRMTLTQKVVSKVPLKSFLKKTILIRWRKMKIMQCSPMMINKVGKKLRIQRNLENIVNFEVLIITFIFLIFLNHNNYNNHHQNISNKNLRCRVMYGPLWFNTFETIFTRTKKKEWAGTLESYTTVN